MFENCTDSMYGHVQIYKKKEQSGQAIGQITIQ